MPTALLAGAFGQGNLGDDARSLPRLCRRAARLAPDGDHP